jgi:hypothetical protein
MQFDRPPEPVPPDRVPGRIQQLRSLRQSVVLWLVVFGLINFVLALYLISASVQNDIARSGATLDSVQELQIRLGTPGPEVQSLTATLTATQNLANQLEEARPPASVNWPIVMAFIGNYNPTRITLTSLTQTGARIVVMGRSPDELAVVEYTNNLKQSNLFSDVVTQSLRRITPDPGATGATITDAIEFVVILDLGEQAS